MLKETHEFKLLLSTQDLPLDVLRACAYRLSAFLDDFYFPEGKCIVSKIKSGYDSNTGLYAIEWHA